MDPISVAVEIELATLLLAGVGAFATWLHNKNQARAHQQRERHQQETRALQERLHAERVEVKTEVKTMEAEMRDCALQGRDPKRSREGDPRRARR